MRVIILGHGWYGCMVAILCIINNIEFIILDKNKEIFSGSSSKNQNRLHLGYHYPRSLDTINECKDGYAKFNYIFDNNCSNINKNIYGIDNNSICDYNYFKKVFDINNQNVINKENLLFDINNNNIEKMFLCKEKLINHNSIKKKFHKLLANYVKIIDISKLQFLDNKIIYDNIIYDYFFNCTYGQSNIGFENLNLDCFYELCITFLYESKINIDTSLTIMDGNFVSLYPYESNNDKKLFTLTHVKHTPIIKSKNINDILLTEYKIINNKINIINDLKTIFEKDIKKYINNFDDIFSYNSYYLSKKCKFNSKTDDRSLKYSKNINKFIFIGGKITGIFSMIDILHNELPNIFKIIDLNSIKNVINK